MEGLLLHPSYNRLLMSVVLIVERKMEEYPKERKSKKPPIQIPYTNYTIYHIYIIFIYADVAVRVCFDTRGT